MRQKQTALVVGFTVLLLSTTLYTAPFIHPGVLAFACMGLALAGYAWRFVRAPSETVEESDAASTANAMTLTWIAMVLVYGSSSVIYDNWFFPTDWRASTSGIQQPLDHGIVRSVLAAMLLTLLSRWNLNWRIFMMISALLMIALAIRELYEATGFAMIYRTDSPSFVYRFWSFQQTFPRPGFYDPHWNAGMPVPYLVASGVWSVGLFLLPFLFWIPAEDLYTPALLFFNVIALPFIAWQSARWVGAGKLARWIAVLLILGPCQRFWVHLLHYGTAPSLFSISMALPIAALWYKLLYREQSAQKSTVALLLFFGLIFFAWPGSLVVATPFVIITMLHIRRLFQHNKWTWILAAAAIGAIMLWPLAAVPLRYSDISSFVNTMPKQTLGQHLQSGLETFSFNIRSTNLLIVLFGFLGTWFIKPNTLRWFLAPLILTLLVLAGWGEEVRPLLQTERLIIPAAFIAILPASIWLEQLIQAHLPPVSTRTRSEGWSRAGTAWLVAILLLGAYQGAKTWDGSGLAPFHAYPDRIDKLVRWIDTEVPEQGRVMFAGRAVHAYGGAKIAALPMLANREMMACDFYGFSPKLVEYQYPPRAFRYSGPDVLFEFNELHNVTHILTWHDDWKNVFDREPDRYQRQYEEGRIVGYSVLRESDMFLVGEGRVEAQFDQFDLSLPGDGLPVVIKYNWAEGLTASDGTRLYPYDAGRGAVFIGLEPGTNQHVTIRYRP